MKGCVQEEGEYRLSSSSTSVASCGQVETVELEHATPVCWFAWCLGMLRVVRKRAISEEEERHIGSAPSSSNVVGRFGQLLLNLQT